MKDHVSPTPYAALLMAGLLTITIPASVSAQSGPRTIEPDHDLDIFHGVQPGEDRLLPGSTLTDRQIRSLNAQGIRTVGDFVRADATRIARETGEDTRTIRQWQHEIRQRLQDN